MSQTDLADLVHRSQGAVSSWEKGTTQPPVDCLVRLARVLQTSVADLFPYPSESEDEAAVT